MGEAEMDKSNETISVTPGVQRRLDGARASRGALAFATLALTAWLGACSGNVLEARPVCIKPHGGANFQLAPSYQCESGMGGSMWVNR
jgi:hypothetical protein